MVNVNTMEQLSVESKAILLYRKLRKSAYDLHLEAGRVKDAADDLFDELEEEDKRELIRSAEIGYMW